MELRVLVLLVMVLASLVVALLTGFLHVKDGVAVPAAARGGAIAFAGTMTLALLVATWLEQS
ncbi:hypothetical protein [Streptomyces sp. NPDC059209]|uniref:hypothetical protein n=1 Tax=Streptomyces sp. NPDC059209 TaxID=3346769 RepID=UPI00367E346A